MSEDQITEKVGYPRGDFAQTLTQEDLDQLYRELPLWLREKPQEAIASESPYAVDQDIMEKTKGALRGALEAHANGFPAFQNAVYTEMRKILPEPNIDGSPTKVDHRIQAGLSSAFDQFSRQAAPGFQQEFVTFVGNMINTRWKNLLWTSSPHRGPNV